jgi:hypothetical protein
MGRRFLPPDHGRAAGHHDPAGSERAGVARVAAVTSSKSRSCRRHRAVCRLFGCDEFSASAIAACWSYRRGRRIAGRRRRRHRHCHRRRHHCRHRPPMRRRPSLRQQEWPNRPQGPKCEQMPGICACSWVSPLGLHPLTSIALQSPAPGARFKVVSRPRSASRPASGMTGVTRPMRVVLCGRWRSRAVLSVEARGSREPVRRLFPKLRLGDELHQRAPGGE